MTKPKTRKGRPNHHYEHTITMGARCPACGSTAARILRVAATRPHPSPGPDGQPCTHTITRRVICTDCGQHRFQTTLENRPAEPKSDQPASKPAEKAKK